MVYVACTRHQTLDNQVHVHVMALYAYIAIYQIAEKCLLTNALDYGIVYMTLAQATAHYIA